MKGKIKIIALLIVLILVIGVIVFQYIDSRAIRTSITESEYREIHSIPDNLSDQEIKEIQNLLKESDIMLFRLEQHRLELEKLVEKNK